jgi:MFS family permease
VAALAGFLFGYDNIVISGAIGYLSQYFKLDAAGTGWAAGCAIVGCLIGSAAAGSIADRFGLKRSLFACAICFALSAVGVWLSSSFSQYIWWRILGGVGIGAASIAAPMYIAEIAPHAVRGRLVVLYQLGIVLGILAAVQLNLFVEKSGTAEWNLEHGWRWMFAMCAFPAAVFGAAILFSKESPRWLMKTGHENEAWRVLAAIGGKAAARPSGATMRRTSAETAVSIRMFPKEMHFVRRAWLVLLSLQT